MASPKFITQIKGCNMPRQKYTDQLTSLHVALSMAPVGKAWENGFRKQIRKFIHAVYNRKWMHSSLHDLAPSQFERQWRHDQCAKSLS